MYSSNKSALITPVFLIAATLLEYRISSNAARVLN